MGHGDHLELCCGGAGRGEEGGPRIGGPDAMTLPATGMGALAPLHVVELGAPYWSAGS